MRRVIGIDIHRAFGGVAIWENGILRRKGRVEMTRTALAGFGRRLERTDEAVIEGEAGMAGRPVDDPPAERPALAAPND